MGGGERCLCLLEGGLGRGVVGEDMRGDGEVGVSGSGHVVCAWMEVLDGFVPIFVDGEVNWRRNCEVKKFKGHDQSGWYSMYTR